ncbi:hypothetical protein HQ531_04675 [bacterium]|nr:hypothetical protein [bacterium]
MFRKKSGKMAGMILMVLSISMAQAQGATKVYPEAKLFMANGFDIEGTNLRMTQETATIEVMGQAQIFMLSDVVQIMAKEGKDKRYAKNCALTCLGCNLIPLIIMAGAPEDELSEEGNATFLTEGLIGAVLYSGLSYGIGYLIGQSTDEWQVIYLNRG